MSAGNSSSIGNSSSHAQQAPKSDWQHFKEYATFMAGRLVRNWGCENRFRSISPDEIRKAITPEKLQKLAQLVGAGESRQIIQMRRMTREAPIICDWLEDRQIPTVLKNSQPEFVDFYMRSHAHRLMKLHNHKLWFQPGKSMEPELLVEGRYVPWSKWRQRMTLTQSGEVLCRSTRRPYVYTHRGWTCRDSGELPVFKVLRKEECPEKPRIEFCFSHQGGTRSLEDIKQKVRHAWVRLYHPKGNLYSFGRTLSKQGVESPDPYEARLSKISTVSFDISEGKFTQVLALANKPVGPFNWRDNNCTSFAAAAAKLCDLPYKRQKMAYWNTLESRIKAFVASALIAKALRKPSFLRKLDDWKHDPTAMVDLISEQIAPGRHPLKDVFSQLLLLNKEKTSKLFKELEDEIRQGTFETLQDKISYLFEDIYASLEDMEYDHPTALEDSLREYQWKKDFQPMGLI